MVDFIELTSETLTTDDHPKLGETPLNFDDPIKRGTSFFTKNMPIASLVIAKNKHEEIK